MAANKTQSFPGTEFSKVLYCVILKINNYDTWPMKTFTSSKIKIQPQQHGAHGIKR